MSSLTILFIVISMFSLIVLRFMPGICITIDEASKYALKEKRMYKYKSWMFFVFRYCQDTSGDLYKKEHKKLDKTNMEHISILSFWLQILCILIFITVIVTMGILSVTISAVEYAKLTKILFPAEVGLMVAFAIPAFVYVSKAEGKAIKRFKAKEKRQEKALMQQLWHKDASTSYTKEVSQDQIIQTSLADSDTTTPI